MATFTPGLSASISSSPVLALVSTTASTLVYNIANLGTGAEGAYVYYRKASGGALTLHGWFDATGNQTITGLIDATKYEVIAIPLDAEGAAGATAAGPLVAVTGTTGDSFGTQELLEAVQEAVNSMVWPGTGNRVLHDAIVVPAESIRSSNIPTTRFPAAFIWDAGYGSALSDEDPSFRSISVGLMIMAAQPGDKRGTSALLGHHRTAGSSVNAGLLHIKKEVMSQVPVFLRSSSPAVRFVGIIDGVPGTAFTDSGSDRAIIEQSYTLQFAIREK